MYKAGKAYPPFPLPLTGGGQGEGEPGARIRVFTTRPDTLFGATFMVLAPEHPMVDRLTTAGQRLELTRPLGAVLGDLLDKPVASGGFAFSRPLASAVLLAAMVACLVAYPQRAAQRQH